MLYDEYNKKDQELTNTANQYSAKQLQQQIDDEAFSALNTAGDYGHKE